MTVTQEVSLKVIQKKMKVTLVNKDSLLAGFLCLSEKVMDIEELEVVLSKYKISKPKFRGSEVENKSLPFMLTTFRNLIKDEIPPTQEEFINEFKSTYPKIKLKGLTSRLKRAYLSYVREYHLGYILRKHFKKVLYDEKIDICGVDYVIYYRGFKFNIHAFVNTESGKYWREIKNGRHKFRGTHLDLPMDLNKGKRCGKLILYTDSDVEHLKREMDKTVSKKKVLGNSVRKPRV